MSYWIATGMRRDGTLVPVPGQFSERRQAMDYLDKYFRTGPARVALYSGTARRCIRPADAVAYPAGVWNRTRGVWSKISAPDAEKRSAGLNPPQAGAGASQQGGGG